TTAGGAPAPASAPPDRGRCSGDNQDGKVIRVKAVLFDLMGTVVPLPPKSRGPLELAECANLLGADPDAFASAWRGSFLERTSGAWGRLPENIWRLARNLGLAVTQKQIDAACAARRRSAALVLEPVPNVQAMLERLRGKGILLAMVTNGAP